MRGEDVQQHAMYSYLSPEERVLADHSLRAIREITDRVLKELSRVFAQMCAQLGRPFIPPEKLLRGKLVHRWRDRQRLPDVREVVPMIPARVFA